MELIQLHCSFLRLIKNVILLVTVNGIYIIGGFQVSYHLFNTVIKQNLLNYIYISARKV